MNKEKWSWANFKGLSQDGQQADFAKTLCTSVSNDFTFSQIHLAGQYLNKKTPNTGLLTE
jgi:hypothetical protein